MVAMVVGVSGTQHTRDQDSHPQSCPLLGLGNKNTLIEV